MTLCRYRVAGWSVHAPRALPYLLPDDGPVAADPIRVEFAPLAPLAGPGTAVGPFTVHAPDLIDLDLPGGPRLRIRDGNTITLADSDGHTAAELHTALFGPAFSVLAHQRGRPPLHAGAVTRAGRTLGIAGHSGAGKSTLVNALLARGARLLSDDQLLVDPVSGLAYPTYPSAKLWAASATRLAVPMDDAARVRAGYDKFHVDLADRFASAPANLDLLLVLAPTPGLAAPAAQPLDRSTATAVLAALTHYADVATASGRAAATLRHAAALAARVPVVRVARPDDFSRLDALVDLALQLAEAA